MRIRQPLIAALVFATAFAALLPASPAAATTAGVPFSADSLPTWQTNATAWAAAASRGRVVVGGQFTQIRPGAGQSGSARSIAGLAILDAATGTPSACQLPAALSGGTPVIYAATASPDGNSVFVGGNFSSIGGVSVSRLAEIDVVNCRVLPFRPPSISSYVESIAVTSDAVYLGGLFQTVGGVQHRSFAKLSRTGALQSWTASAWGNTVDKYTSTVVPDANAHGTAITVSPDGSRVVLGGDFFTVNGTSTHSIAVVDASSGAVVRAYPGLVGNTSRTRALQSDGTTFFMGNEGSNNFDGTMAFSWSSLDRLWIDNCQGAVQALLVYQGVMFQAHHHHDCSSQGLFPDGRRTYASVTRTDDPAQRILGWLPELNNGTGEGLGGRAIAVSTEGTPSLWYVGEFTRVNGVAQQGLTRFASTDTGAPPTPSIAARAITPRAIQVAIKSVVDPDDEDIAYAVYRGNDTTTPIWTGTVKSQWWYRPQATFVDTAVSPGTTYSYRVVAIDAAGNRSPLSSTASVAASSAGSAYASGIVASSPALYWRYDDIAGSAWVIDSSGATTAGLEGIAYGSVPRTGPGAIAGDASAAAQFDGSTQYVYNDVIAYGPTTYSIETWFQTTSTTGGAMVDYGNGRARSDTGVTSLSTNADRVLYMDSAGRLQFGVNSGGRRTLRTATAYNDGAWHHTVATQGPSGMRLYVDGVLVGQNAVTGSSRSYGSWRVGADNLNRWPDITADDAAQRYFDGRLDETAVYTRALTAAEVSAHLNPAPPADTTAPSTPSGLAATSPSPGAVGLTWSAASDDVGVAGYRVYRGTTSGFTADAASQVGDVGGTSYSATGVPPGTWYYRVAAYDAAGNLGAATAAASVVVQAAGTTTVVLQPAADTMVAENNPSGVYGTSTQLSSRAQAGSTLESYLRFALPAAPPGSTLTGATLRVTTSTDSTATSSGAHQIRLMSGAWDESSTTWTSRTTVLGAQIGELSGAPGLNTGYTVTLDATQLAGLRGNVDLALASTSSDNLRIWSREFATAQSRPTLTLTYALR